MLKQLIRQAVAGIWHPLYRVGELVARPSPSPGAFRILALHHISQSQQEAFERLLRYLIKAHGIITPEEAVIRLQGGVCSQQRLPYLLTFDDGFQSHACLVREILEAYGLKAIFFICPGLIETPRSRHREVIARVFFDPPRVAAQLADDLWLLSWQEAELLVRSGHELGCHSHMHRPLKAVPDEELTQEIVTPGEIISRRLGIPVQWFAHPLGRNTALHSQASRVIDEHYRFCCSTYPGINSSQTHPLRLLRTGINLGGPFRYQQMVLAGGLDFLYRREIREMARLTDVEPQP